MTGETRVNVLPSTLFLLYLHIGKMQFVALLVRLPFVEMQISEELIEETDRIYSRP
jgi:hypothetical protein